MSTPRVVRSSHEVAGFIVHRVRCHPAEATARTRVAVVLFHGFGAPGSDLVPIGHEVLDATPSLAASVEFFFPEAPLSLGGSPPYDSRAWWMLDTQRLEEMMSGAAPRDMGNQTPSELADLRPRILQVLDWIASECGITPEDLVLGGFSQGAMLATDVALNAGFTPAGLVAFSGTMLSERLWTSRAPERAGMRVLLSHGRRDPLLSFDSAERLSSMLSAAGARVRFVPFDGVHEIPMPALRALLQLLEEVLRERSQ